MLVTDETIATTCLHAEGGKNAFSYVKRNFTTFEGRNIREKSRKQSPKFRWEEARDEGLMAGQE